MKKQLYTKLLTLLCILGIPMFSMASDFTLSSANTVEQDGITISFAKGSGSNAPAWYQAGLRLYANNTITISSTGNNISGVTFNWEKQGSKAFATVTADPGTYQHPSAAGQGVWSGSAKSITFTLGSSGQLQLNTLTVTLETSGGESTKEANDLTLNATEKTFDLKDGDGQTFQLTNSGVADGALSFASNNGAVATVSEAGLITAVGEGTATITVTQAASETYEGGSATCVVTVTDSRYIVSNLTFSGKCNGTGTADNGAAWTVESDGTESNFDTNKGIHYGTGSSPVQYIQLKSSDFSGIIQKVVVNASHANGVEATVAVTVGGEAFGGDPKTLNTTATDYNFTGSASGEIEVTVTKDASATGALYVKSVKVYYTPSSLASIEVTGAPTTFHKGDVFSHDGAKVTATYEDKTTKDVTKEATFTGYDMNVVGEQTVTVSYTEGEETKTDTYTINVNAPATLTGITLSGEYPTTLYVGDAFSHEGMVVTASYDDETTKDVTDEATFTGYDMSAKGKQTVTVSYTDGGVTKTATYDITLSLKPGSEALPYTVAEARAAIVANEGVTGVYAKGIVSGIVTAYDPDYGNITFDISVDGTTTSEQLRAYRGKSYNGVNFTSDNDIKVGDEVVIYGELTLYHDNKENVDIYEFKANNQLVSLERANFITDAANATWVAPAKVKVLSEGVQVYTVTYDDAVGCTRKHEVADKVIPANEAVLLTSSKGAATVKIEVTTDEAAAYADLDNDLLGSDGTIQGGTNIFCLAVGDKGLGFYPVSDEIYVPAGKAYLLIPAAQAAPSYLWFNGDTTAIDSLTTDTAAGNESGEIYSLTGQRVGKNYRGIVIMNGRKVLKK